MVAALQVIGADAADLLVDTAPTAGRKLADVILETSCAPTGSYIHRTKTMRSSAESYNTDREEALWDWMEQQS